MPNHLTPEEIAAEHGLDREQVIRFCVEHDVPCSRVGSTRPCSPRSGRRAGRRARAAGYGCNQAEAWLRMLLSDGARRRRALEPTRLLRPTAKSSCFRSKKLCGAPSYVTTSCSTPAAVSAASKAALCSAVMCWSSPAWSARIGARISRGPLGRAGNAVPLGGHPVEADRPGEPVPGGGGEPRVAAAEAEADGEDRRAAGRAQVRDRRGDVRLDAVRRRLHDVLHVVEVVVALRHPGGAAEVVERDRRVAALREAERQLLVEAVEAADVGQDHDPRRGRLLRHGLERREAVPVGGLEHEIVVRDGGARR